MQTQAQAQQAQVQQAKNISDQIKQERLRQHNILESQRMSNEPSLASALGDPASSLASSGGSAASSATSSLLLNPIKGTAHFIKESLTSPSLRSPSVKIIRCISTIFIIILIRCISSI